MKNGPYTLIIAPPDFPGKRYRERYCYEHVYVWWKAHGTLPQANATVIHHKNGNKTDNRLDNLELCSRKAHDSHHRKPVKTVDVVCAWCGKVFVLTLRHFKMRKASGHKNLFCCRSHAVSHQQKERWSKRT